MVYNISGAFFDSSEVVVGTNKSEKKKGENKKRKGLDLFNWFLDN